MTVTQTNTENPSFVISTSETSPSLIEKVLASAFPKASISEPKIDEVVNNAIKTAFADELEIQQNLIPEVISKEKKEVALDAIKGVKGVTEIKDGIGVVLYGYE